MTKSNDRSTILPISLRPLSSSTPGFELDAIINPLELEDDEDEERPDAEAEEIEAEGLLTGERKEREDGHVLLNDVSSKEWLKVQSPPFSTYLTACSLARRLTTMCMMIADTVTSVHSPFVTLAHFVTPHRTRRASFLFDCDLLPLRQVTPRIICTWRSTDWIESFTDNRSLQRRPLRESILGINRLCEARG